MSDDVSEAEEIETQIAAYGWTWADWVMAGQLSNTKLDAARTQRRIIMDRIHSIITERDALKNAARSHRE